MNYEDPRRPIILRDWPKWTDAVCEKCGELVPRGMIHRCIKDKDAEVLEEETRA